MQLNTQISAVLRGAVSRGIKAAEVDARGNLVFTLTDNSRLDMGMVHGTDITKVEQTVTGSGDGGENTITVTLSDGTEHSFTIRNGSKGDRGTVSSCWAYTPPKRNFGRCTPPEAGATPTP